MKILYLNYIPSPYRVDFFNELSKHCQLQVVYYNAQIAERPSWKYNKAHHQYTHTFLFKNETRWTAPGGYIKLIRILNSNKDHLVVVGGYARPVEIFAINWLRLKKRPFILNTDGGFFQGGRIKLLLKKWLVKSAAHYLASGSLAAQTLKQYGANPARITNYRFSSIFEKEVLPSVPSPHERENIRKQLSIPVGASVILTIGRYIPLKGFELVIEALALLANKKIILYMLGEGPLRDQYQKLIDQHALSNHVYLMGNQSKTRVLDYCKAADVMVLPTITSDVWGLVINEAMSCGLPVIASNRVGAAYDMVTEGQTGYMVPAGEAKAIAGALGKVILNSAHLSKGALKMAQRYTIETMVQDHLSHFSSHTKTL